VLLNVQYRIAPRAVAVAAALALLFSYLLVVVTPGRASAASPLRPSAVMLTEDPMAGDEVTFAISGSPDTESFVYSVTHGPSSRVPAVDGEAVITVAPPPGYIDHYLQVWARNADGDSPRFDLLFTTRFPSEAGWWQLAGDGTDTGYSGQDLLLPNGVDWVEDSTGMPESAMQLTGSQCASTSGPVVDTTRSFSVSAWVKLDNKDGDQVVISQAGRAGIAVELAYRQNSDALELHVTDADRPARVTKATVASMESARVGTWAHVTGVVDQREKQLRLFINGVLRGEAPLAFDLWSATGSVHVGCSAVRERNGLSGALHDVRVIDGIVDGERAGAIRATPLSYWPLDGSGVDTVGGNDLVLHGDHQWVDNRDGRPGTAYQVAGGGYAESSGPSIRTDESLTLSLWVVVDGSSSLQTLLAQTGDEQDAIGINYNGETGRFEFAMTSDDSTSATVHKTVSQTTARVGSWYHVAAVFDVVTGEMRLYVNGQQESIGAGPAQPWHGGGPVYVAAVRNGGEPENSANAALDEIAMYTGILSDEQIDLIGCDPIWCGW